MITAATKIYSLTSDEELLKLLVHGDTEAFTEIYNRYWKKLFVKAAGKLDNLTEAEEVVQDIFLELWNRRESLEINSLSNYVTVAVKYKVLDRYAKRAQQLKYQKYAAASFKQADCSTEQWLNYEELMRKLNRSVASLPEKCRLVFELSRNKGLSHKQISARMGIAEKTVEAHLTKALHVLRVSLGSLFLLLLIFL